MRDDRHACRHPAYQRPGFCHLPLGLGEKLNTVSEHYAAITALVYRKCVAPRVTSAHELDLGLPKAHTACMEAMSGMPPSSGHNSELAAWREPDQLVSNSSLSRLGIRLGRNREAQRHLRCKQQVLQATVRVCMRKVLVSGLTRFIS